MRSPLIIVLGLAVATLVPVMPADAAPVSQTGTVGHVSDGDTIDVNISGTNVRVRMSAIQAMELGECHADAATARLKQLVMGQRVTAWAKDSASSNRGRALRFIDRGTQDIGLTMIREGHAFAFPMPDEPMRNERYLHATASARARGVGIWNPRGCGAGPADGVPLELTVKWDADGNDSVNVNDEWVRIRNLGSAPVPLKGWTLRDSALNVFTLPSVSVPAGGAVYAHVGKGTNTANDVYLGSAAPIFENDVGDGALLVDPRGNVRASFFYPCIGVCPDPARGKVAVTVNYDAAGNDNDNPNGEWIDVTNTSSGVIDLEGYLLEAQPLSRSYDLRGPTKLAPKESLRIHMGAGTDSRLKRYWGFSSGALNNSGGSAILKTFDDRRIVCRAWQKGRCPSTAVHPVSRSADTAFDHWTAPVWTDTAFHSFGDLTKSWQHTPVGFLSANQITEGVSASQFAPDRPVTRGEMAAFLWRLAGRPHVSTAHGFVDVTKGWQQGPVRWLEASGITMGVDATHFAPDRRVTRGEMAAFLWRLVDEPNVTKPHGFGDIEKSWQEIPVRWLRAKGITNGISSTEFGPDEAVTRGQMSAFLHRLAQRL